MIFMATTTKNNTTIQVMIETRDELQTLGTKGETYDVIIKRLIKVHRECKCKK
jgi:hypothetical protein